MEKEQFNTLLQSAGLTVTEFCALSGAAEATVRGWGTSGKRVPAWAGALLDLYIENRRLGSGEQSAATIKLRRIKAILDE